MMLESQFVSDNCNFWHEFNWQVNQPFILAWQIEKDVIDHYGHVNNAAYVKQMETLAWAHSQSLGLGIEDYRALDRAMVIKSHHIDYMQACHLEDMVASATWIEMCDKRLRLRRGFQFMHMQSQKTVLMAKTDYVSCTLSTGRPVKMPKAFATIYSDNVQQEVNEK